MQFHNIPSVGGRCPTVEIGERGFILKLQLKSHNTPNNPNEPKDQVMDRETKTAKAKHLAKTIMDDLVALLSANISSEQSDDAGIAEALKQNVDKITCFSDLHDYMDANTLGESEEIWEELTNDIGPEGDERKVQIACDVLNEAQDIVDKWIRQGCPTVSPKR
jgi:hypothetical protein